MRKHIDLSCLGSPAGWLAVGALLCAPAGLAQAQLAAPNGVAGTAPGAVDQVPKPTAVTSQVPSPAPSVVPLPPQPSPPQIGIQGPSQTPAQAPNAAATQAPSDALNQAASPSANQSASLPAAPEGKRGFLNDLGQWWNDSIANFNAKLKEQQAKLDEFNKKQAEAAKDATQAMKNAADAMFTPSKVIEVQQPCPVAGNGAPDCAGAATNVCKAKGFSDGHPMDIRTAERCKASLWVSGQTPSATDCSLQTVLLRVACQP